MAKYRVEIPITKLLTAMLIPSGSNPKDPEGKVIPSVGFGIVENPFEKKSKKKKGKKKRRH